MDYWHSARSYNGSGGKGTISPRNDVNTIFWRDDEEWECRYSDVVADVLLNTVCELEDAFVVFCESWGPAEEENEVPRVSKGVITIRSCMVRLFFKLVQNCIISNRSLARLLGWRPSEEKLIYPMLKSHACDRHMSCFRIVEESTWVEIILWCKGIQMLWLVKSFSLLFSSSMKTWVLAPR